MTHMQLVENMVVNMKSQPYHYHYHNLANIVLQKHKRMRTYISKQAMTMSGMMKATTLSPTGYL